jgi:hypothetical protein
VGTSDLYVQSFGLKIEVRAAHPSAQNAKQPALSDPSEERGVERDGAPAA